MTENKKRNVGNGIGIGAALGLLFGLIYGNKSGNVSQGIAFGIVDYSHDEILELISSSDIKDKQLIHTDNMFILK